MKIAVKYYFVISITIITQLLFLFCNATEYKSKQRGVSSSYYPLKVGNWWLYKSNEDSLLITVDSIVTINNLDYYKITETKIISNKKRTVDYDYYRIVNNKTILKHIVPCDIDEERQANLGLKKLSGTDWIWYKYDSNIHFEAYSNSYLKKEYDVIRFDIYPKVKDDTIIVINRKYNKYNRIEFDSPWESSNNRIEYFVEGIGMVKRSVEFIGEIRTHYILINFHLGNVNKNE